MQYDIASLVAKMKMHIQIEAQISIINNEEQNKEIFYHNMPREYIERLNCRNDIIHTISMASSQAAPS